MPKQRLRAKSAAANELARPGRLIKVRWWAAQVRLECLLAGVLFAIYGSLEEQLEPNLFNLFNTMVNFSEADHFAAQTLEAWLAMRVS